MGTNQTCDTDFLDFSGLDDKLLSFKKNMLSGAYSKPNSPLADMPPVCDSGDCTFPEFVSLGVCVKMANVTDRLRVARLPDKDWNLFGLKDNTTWVASLPISALSGDSSLTTPNIGSLAFYTDNIGRSLGFENDDKTAIMSLYFIYSNPPAHTGRPLSFYAVEVMFHACTKAYFVKVTNTSSVWEERGRTADVRSNNATSLNFIKNPAFMMCFLDVAKSCDEKLRGQLVLSPPSGYESHTTVRIDEMSAASISAAMYLSFETNLGFFGTKTRNSGDGGSVMIGKGVYRVDGDVSMALAANLWGAAPEKGKAFDPERQLRSVTNMFENMAKGFENT